MGRQTAMTDPADSRLSSTGNKRAHPAELAALGGAIIVFWTIAVTRLDSTALWADEAWSLAAVNDLGLSLRSSYGTTALYYSLLWGWGKLGTSTVWLRLFSTVFATGTIVATQMIARRVGGFRLAVVAPLLLAVSPMFVWTGTEVRGYALETLFVVVCWYSAIVICARTTPVGRRRRWQVTITLLAGLGPLVHGLFFAQVAAIGCWSLLSSARRRNLRLLAPAFAATILVTLGLEIIGQGSLGASIAGGTPEMFRQIRSWYFAADSWLSWIAVTLVLVALIDIAIDQLRAGRGNGNPIRPVRWVGVMWTFVPMAILFIVHLGHAVWTPYYLTPIAPGVALLIGSGALRIVEPLRDHRRVARIATIAVPLLVVGALAFSVSAHPQQPDQDWRGAAQDVARHARTGDAIIFGTGEPDLPVASRPGFEAAWREVPHETVPESIYPIRPLGEVLRADDYPDDERFASLVRGHTRIWAVDYQHMFDHSGLTSRAPMDNDFRVARTRHYRGGISVTLYVAADRSSPK